MALFKRSELKKQGLTEEQIDYLMTESNRALANDYMLKSDAEEQLSNALSNVKPQPVEETDEYKTLLAENLKIKTLQNEVFDTVKKPYKEIVWQHLNHNDGHVPYVEQLAEMTKQMPDLFINQNDESVKPQFGADVTGEMPKGKKASTFLDYWKRGD